MPVLPLSGDSADSSGASGPWGSGCGGAGDSGCGFTSGSGGRGGTGGISASDSGGTTGSGAETLLPPPSTSAPTGWVRTPVASLTDAAALPSSTVSVRPDWSGASSAARDVEVFVVRFAGVRAAVDRAGVLAAREADVRALVGFCAAPAADSVPALCLAVDCALAPVAGLSAPVAADPDDRAGAALPALFLAVVLRELVVRLADVVRVGVDEADREDVEREDVPFDAPDELAPLFELPAPPVVFLGVARDARAEDVVGAGRPGAAAADVVSAAAADSPVFAESSGALPDVSSGVPVPCSPDADDDDEDEAEVTGQTYQFGRPQSRGTGRDRPKLQIRSATYYEKATTRRYSLGRPDVPG